MIWNWLVLEQEINETFVVNLEFTSSLQACAAQTDGPQNDTLRSCQSKQVLRSSCELLRTKDKKDSKRMISWTFPEPSMIHLWTFPEHSLNHPWTFPEPSGTFRDLKMSTCPQTDRQKDRHTLALQELLLRSFAAKMQVHYGAL